MLIYKKKYIQISHTHTNISVLSLKLHASMLTIQEDNIALYKRHTHKIGVISTSGTCDMHIKVCSFAVSMLDFALLQCLCLYCVQCILRIDTKLFFFFLVNKEGQSPTRSHFQMSSISMIAYDVQEIISSLVKNI